jgi:uncharacterized cupredoxin-like copper-binding protein
MLSAKHKILALIIALSPVTISAPAFAAETTIKVSLWDKGPDSADIPDTMPEMGMGMAHAGDQAMAKLGIKLDHTTVPAGKVTFEVANSSKDIVHEMIVSPIADPTKPLPYDAEGLKANEDAAGHLGEVAELDPSQTGALTLELTPGTYVVYCNLPGHLAMGMWSLLKVEG